MTNSSPVENNATRGRRDTCSWCRPMLAARPSSAGDRRVPAASTTVPRAISSPARRIHWPGWGTALMRTATPPSAVAIASQSSCIKTASAPALAANPSALAFGAQTVGGAAVTQNVTLTNNGNVALGISSIAASGAAGVTAGAGTCGASLAIGASCVVPVSFAPTAAGNVTATLLVRSNAPDLQVAVTGAGTTAAVAKPVLSDTGPLVFADTQLGKSSAARSTVLRNDGSAALKIASLLLGGSHPGDFVLAGSCTVNGTLSPAASCTIDSTFKPTAAGARSAGLVLVTDGGAQLNLNLSGNGVAVPAGATLTVSPQSFDFGAATVGATAPAKRFTLTNTGSAALNLASATFTGPFSAVTDGTSCAAAPFTLQPGASCELVVRYAPTAAGTSTGNVKLQGDAASSWTIALTLHESAPGHAFQMPIALEQKGRPAFRNAYISAYGEGWALYTERLGVEMGIYETPYEIFGMLSYQAWRASRLVVDTGVHAKGWTREQAQVAHLAPQVHRELVAAVDLG
eukprot:gene37584-46365_t